jgi:hypothetical protein
VQAAGFEDAAQPVDLWALRDRDLEPAGLGLRGDPVGGGRHGCGERIERDIGWMKGFVCYIFRGI